ncbi:hypothetical protein KR018_012041 [Drosophila ironensis]|nr:hypothetical protein KR018_012041 [Drosophila ironensis]
MHHGEQSLEQPPGAAHPAKEKDREKRGWFHSLTRRKKSDSALALSAHSSSGSSTSAPNNNNEVAGPDTSIACSSNGSSAGIPSGSSSGGGTLSRRREKRDRNMFAKLRDKVRGFALRNWRSMGDNDSDGGTTDATYEFLTPAIRSEPTLLFTHDYSRFIRKKWLEREECPNLVMYKACSEMLNQVWYWGEISRRDSQRQLSDKPTGSFLVRDSETSGSQFTLSFRIMNVTLHYRLEFRDNFWYFEELKYESIVEMIEDILHRCLNNNFVCFVKVPNELHLPLPVNLKYPLSRYAQMPKLQDLCRRVLQRQMTREQLAQLPVPAQMLEYLSVERELVFQS